MARVRGITEKEATPELQELFQRQRTIFGDVLNTTPVFALRPTIMEGSNALAAGIDASGLIEPSLKYLVCTKTAWINGCPF
ncbi:MAG: hypothetical protein BZY81_05315 [SAR202 cluster bacterium Io17-Chloro-G4]|nr:MAG: hypothetical protein BZY81_05315 [SAR202 cluster bacterium Io17-Chloro-G4]